MRTLVCGNTTNMRRIALASLLLLTALAPPVALAHGGEHVERAGRELRSDPVYVDPEAVPTISQEQAEELRDRIAQAGGGIYVAVLPAATVDEAGSAEEVLSALAAETRRRGTYAVVVGGQFRAGSNGPERGEVPAIAREAFAEHRGEGAAGIAPALLDLVDGVAEARGGEAAGRDDGEGAGAGDDGPGGLGLGVLAAIAAGALGFFALRRRRRESDELRQVKEVAEEDLVALADDIRALDLDVEMPNVDPRAKEDYARALTAYERASDAFKRARSPEDMEAVSAALEEGRYAMVSAKARLEGTEPPPHRPPCFFDPRHGPSVRDVMWAPPGGEPRPVPACAADAIRIEEGEEPEAREIMVGGARTPYWNAPPAYGPWAGGFFGGAAGALLPMLFVGSMLGSGFGFGPTIVGGDDHGDGGFDGGDFGGGDFGDMGGGDFGGGDFGGGDF